MFEAAQETHVDNWDEVKTAYQVARLGTVSGAAEVLGVHHATVIRHIDALEARLGVKLFQRHARGYTPTEAGEELRRVAQATDDQFGQLAGRIKGRGAEVSGDLVVTSLVSLAGRMVPLLASFQADYPDVVVRFLTGNRLFRLEYGEAHVAVRAGAPPEQPDNVVQPLATLQVGLFGSKEYVAQFGLLKAPDDFSGHRFVGHDDNANRAPYFIWMDQAIPRGQVTFRTTDMRAGEHAVKAGAGIGFFPYEDGLKDPDLVEFAPPREAWSAQLWLVTHVDLHRTNKVQALLKFLKERAKEGAI